MKHWFVLLLFLVVGSAHAWTGDEYAKTMRTTVSEMDAYYTAQMQSVYSDPALQNHEKKTKAAGIHAQWTSHRAKVVQDMQKLQAELKSYEARQLNSSVRIRAKLQQTLGEIQQWRNAELGRLQNQTLTPEEKTRKRLEVNEASDARSRQVQASAKSHEDALRQLIGRVEQPMFVPPSDTSAFALKHRP